LAVGSIVILIWSFQARAVAAEEGEVVAGQPAGGPQEPAKGRAPGDGPLKLEIMVSVIRVPATLVLRATNVSKEDVTLQGFGKNFKWAA
jgi:hypothetical protein